MPQSKFTFEAIGTFFEITTDTPLKESLKKSIRTLVERFDAQFSRFRIDSVVTKISKSPGIYVFAEESEVLFSLYETLYKITESRVTPLIGDSLEALGYDAGYSLQKKRVTPAREYSKLVRRKGSTLEVREPVMLDYGAAGKGYLVDCMAHLLEAEGVNAYVIDASGDILHWYTEPEVIGLEDPFHEGKVIGEITLQHRALCASAINRRRWGEGLHHVVDPLTGLPAEGIVATWVIADSTMVADGLATALFFTDPETLKQRYNYEYMRVYSDGRAEFSAAFTGALY